MANEESSPWLFRFGLSDGQMTRAAARRAEAKDEPQARRTFGFGGDL
jgi:hypothetical protein